MITLLTVHISYFHADICMVPIAGTMTQRIFCVTAKAAAEW